MFPLVRKITLPDSGTRDIFVGDLADEPAKKGLEP